MNPTAAELDHAVDNTDYLIFVYAFDPARDMDMQIFEQIMRPLYEQSDANFRDSFTSFALTCNHDEGHKYEIDMMDVICAQESPLLQLLVPPMFKYNPYTGQLASREAKPYQEQGVSQDIIKKWIVGNIPDFSTKIDSSSELNSFLSDDQPEVNKIVLYSSKDKTPNIYKALTNEFRDRVRFGFVSQKKVSDAENIEQFSDSSIKLPLLEIVQSCNKEGELLDEVKKITYPHSEYVLADMIDFISKYARDDKVQQSKKETIKQSKKKGAKLTKVVDLDESNIYEKVLDHHKGAIIYFYQEDAAKDLTDDFPLIYQLSEEVRGSLIVGAFKVTEQNANFVEQDLSLKGITSKKGQLRYYQSSDDSFKKIDTSYQLINTESTEKVLAEIQDSMQHNIRDISEQLFDSLAGQIVRDEQKNVIYFAYEHGQEIPIEFKALSNDPYLKPFWEFFAIFAPSEFFAMRFGHELTYPMVGGILKADSPEDNEIKQFQMQLAQLQGDQIMIEYDEMHKNMVSISGAEDQMQAMKQQEKLKKEAVNRQFVEISTNKVFKDNCIKDKKGCAIALLPAMNLIDYEEENFKQHLQVMQEVEEATKYSPVTNMWINGTCHGDFLKYFDIDPLMLPSVVFYYPSQHYYAKLIGKFDTETILDHHDKMTKGKLSTWTPNTAHSKSKKDLKIEELDCANMQLDGFSDDDDAYDEILQEILAEAAERERELQEQNKKDKKSSKDKKKKKKDKKKKNKDDL